jgi:hypothetical protein
MIPKPSKNRDAVLLEPYPQHRENPAKLQEHMNGVFLAGARLLRSAIDAPFVDAAATLENADHFQTEMARDTVVLPHCGNAFKFYSSLGVGEPDAFHKMIVKASHQNLKNAFNSFAAKKQIRSGAKWEHYCNKHLADLHDSAAFNRKITASAPVYKKQVAAPTGRPSLLPPVRPPTTHTMPPKLQDSKYANMPELRSYKPDPEDLSWEGEERPASQQSVQDGPPELGQPISNHHHSEMERAKFTKKLMKAERKGKTEKIAKYKRKLAAERYGMGKEYEGMPELKVQEGKVGFFREIYYGERKRHAQRKGDKKGEAKYKEREESLEDKKDASNRAEHMRRERNKEADERRREEADLEGEMPPPLTNEKVSSRQKQAEDVIDHNDPAEALKSVKWLRECSNATGAQKLTLDRGKTYIFFAPTDAMIDRLMEKFASTTVGALSKERVVSAHLAKKGSTTSFETLAGVRVEKVGTRITYPALKNPEIVGAEGGRVSSILVKGCRVVVLPHDNLFQVQKK